MNDTIRKLSWCGAIVIALVAWTTLFTGCASNTQTIKATEKSAESFTPKLITSIHTTEDSESSIVRIGGTQLLSYTSVKQPLPLSVILYFPETALDNIQSNFSPESDIIAGIKSSELTAKGQASKIEISLKKDVSYEVAREDTGLNVVFKKTPSMSVSAKPELEKEEPSVDTSVANGKQPAAADQKVLTAQTKTREVAPSDVKENSPAWINRIDFSSETAGQSTIIVGTTTPVKYNLKKINDKKLLLNLYHSALPDYRQRPLVTTRFQSAVDRIIPFQTPAMKDTSGFLIELRDSVPYFIEQTDNLILVHFEASSVPPRPLDAAELPPWKNVMTQAADHTKIKQKKIDGKTTQFKVPQKYGATRNDKSTKVFEEGTVMGWDYDIDRQKVTDRYTGIKKPLDFYRTETEKKYTGEKISVDFYKTNIENVFRILREVSGENIAVDKNVTGEVTLSLSKPMPWDQVLTLVLKMNQLGLIYEEGVFRIATLQTLQKEEAERNAKLKELRAAENQEALITVFMPVNYKDAAEIAKHLSDERGKSKFNPGREGAGVSVDTGNNTIIMSDVARVIKRAKEIVQKLDQVTPQVIIEARIVEASDNFTREFGTSWGVSGEKTGSTSSLGYDMSATNPPTSSKGEIGIQFSRLVGDQFRVLDARLMASESEGSVKIISAPKILTLDNKSAKIKQGLAYPYNKLDADGNTTTEWKDIALELEVTPHVTADNRIAMKITIKNNEIGEIINNETSFTTKEAYTELLVDDGDTVIIGGIQKTRKATGESGVPFLNKIPVLGWLFKTEKKEGKKEELLIFISPRILKLEQAGIQE